MKSQAHVESRTVTAEQALRSIQSGNRVFIGSGCAEPTRLVAALAGRTDVTDVEVLHIMTIGHAPYTAEALKGRFRHNAFFIGPNVREAVGHGEADYTPVFLSEIPDLFRTGRLKLDVALVTVTPPDARGFCSLGVSVDVVKSAVEAAAVIVAEINPNMPRTHGASFIPAEDIDFFVRSDSPILEIPIRPPDEVSRRIGRFCAGLIDHGATLQMGIGSIPDAVLLGLTGKRDLGVHSEMVSDGIIDLVEAGVITGRRKTLHPGKAVTSFCMGTRRLYDFVNDNPFFEFLPTEFVNDPFVIAQNEKMVSINSALQVDLTGQVCADSIGTRFYSGIGGQVDFIRGAARSKGGRSILALSSTAKSGTISRIAATLTEGAGVVTTRGDVDTVVTEHGIAELKGRTVRERALSLIGIAHPDFRPDLLAAARRRHYVTVEQIPWPREGRPYPVELESRRLFGDLDVQLRPLKASDERMLRDLFYSCSTETTQAPTKSLPPEQVQRLCTLDYDGQMALGAFVHAGSVERMIAVARYSRDRASDLAEAAVVVHDDCQGKGIGTHLLKRIIEIARDRGVRRFEGYVRADNIRMLSLFHRIGVPVETVREGDTVTVRFGFPPAGKA